MATRTIRLGILLQLAALAVGCGPRDDLPAADQIDSVVEDAAHSGFSGNVLVTQAGKVVYSRSVGQADRAKGTPNRQSNRFLIASLSKPFTAVLVLQLVEEGRLKLASRLDEVFPPLRGTPAGNITVHQLLSHTSGIEELTERHLDRPLVPGDLSQARLTSTPGAFRYSSSGYVVLKLVIEQVSGQSYSERLNARILEPAGMTESGLARTMAGMPNAAAGHTKDGDEASPGVPLEILDGAGSLYSTVGDLAKFDRALAENRILSAQSQKLMAAQQTPSGENEWGYGWALAEQGGRWYTFHEGDFAGFTGVLARQVHRDELLVILANSEAADVSSMRKEIMRIMKRTKQ